MFTTCSELVVGMYWTGKSMNNLLSYCGLVVERISASEKDLPVILALTDFQTFRRSWDIKQKFIIAQSQTLGSIDLLVGRKEGQFC